MVQYISHILASKLHSETSKTKAGALFCKSHCATCSSACVILHHVTGLCKGPIQTNFFPCCTIEALACKITQAKTKDDSAKPPQCCGTTTNENQSDGRTKTNLANQKPYF